MKTILLLLSLLLQSGINPLNKFIFDELTPQELHMALEADSTFMNSFTRIHISRWAINEMDIFDKAGWGYVTYGEMHEMYKYEYTNSSRLIEEATEKWQKSIPTLNELILICTKKLSSLTEYEKKSPLRTYIWGAEAALEEYSKSTSKTKTGTKDVDGTYMSLLRFYKHYVKDIMLWGPFVKDYMDETLFNKFPKAFVVYRYFIQDPVSVKFDYERLTKYHSPSERPKPKTVTGNQGPDAYQLD